MVRIIAGHWKGRRIKTTEGEGYRPAMGRTREAVFSMLASRGVCWESARVLDVFAGSGSLGWEALSRGASKVCFLESDAKALRLLREQALAFERPGQTIRILAGDALRTLDKSPRQPGYEVLFFDPPYGRDLLVKALALAIRHGWMAPDALICAEVEKQWTPSSLPHPELALQTDRTYGQTRICIWTFEHGTT
ncbi:16S rRNA (guanine(966)-N(2))-methyltransferase RsmD [Desulfonatronum thioautotrophicum]|uniref:16S rRNA (guanine(966)-N(2))-methyltransferase RsmD n=1 Tax=Desulfonatronum thioautotrophicum TaxID=617001 RepID=UPI0005EBEA5B|nr:16S rRNA (guanine(966)-N(2))-methyltransferase RsmD [Desulfonatronum thioautotrophicum]